MDRIRQAERNEGRVAVGRGRLKDGPLAVYSRRRLTSAVRKIRADNERRERENGRVNSLRPLTWIHPAFRKRRASRVSVAVRPKTIQHWKSRTEFSALYLFLPSLPKMTVLLLEPSNIALSPLHFRPIPPYDTHAHLNLSPHPLQPSAFPSNTRGLAERNPSCNVGQ